MMPNGFECWVWLTVVAAFARITFVVGRVTPRSVNGRMATISHEILRPDLFGRRIADGPSPLATLQHHNHRFRIDFELGESIEQTKKNRERREIWLATDKQFADTAEQNDDEFLLAVLETHRSATRRSLGRKLLANWLRPLAIGALINSVICTALAFFSIQRQKILSR